MAEKLIAVFATLVSIVSPNEIVSCVPAGIVTRRWWRRRHRSGAGCEFVAAELGWDDELGEAELEGEAEFEELFEGVEDLLHPPIERATARHPATRVIRMIGSCPGLL